MAIATRESRKWTNNGCMLQNGHISKWGEYIFKIPMHLECLESTFTTHSSDGYCVIIIIIIHPESCRSTIFCWGDPQWVSKQSIAMLRDICQFIRKLQSHCDLCVRWTCTKGFEWGGGVFTWPWSKRKLKRIYIHMVGDLPNPNYGTFCNKQQQATKSKRQKVTKQIFKGVKLTLSPWILGWIGRVVWVFKDSLLLHFAF